MPKDPKDRLPIGLERAIHDLIQFGPLPLENFMESLEEARRSRDEFAAKELDRLANELAVKEAERKRLWGNKFPRVLGQKPSDTPLDHKSINRVKPQSQHERVLVKECANCNKKFEPNSGRQIFCGSKCRYTSWNLRMREKERRN